MIMSDANVRMYNPTYRFSDQHSNLQTPTHTVERTAQWNKQLNHSVHEVAVWNQTVYSARGGIYPMESDGTDRWCFKTDYGIHPAQLTF
jgi:hypothetical protein